MRVLLPNHFPLEGSGSGIYTQNVARELVSKGHSALAIVPDHYEQTGFPFEVNTILFTPDGGQPEGGRLPFNFPCFTTHPLSNTQFGELDISQQEAYVSAFQSAIDSALTQWQPDVIHAQHLWVTAFCAQKTGLPYVATAHGTDQMGIRKYDTWKALALEGAKGARYVIAVSRRVADDTRALYSIPDERVRLVSGGFDQTLFRVLHDVRRASVLEAHGLPADPGVVVCFVSKLTHFKGVDVLLEAATVYEQALGNVLTLIVGDGELRADLEAQARGYRLKGVHFLGHQPQTNVAEIYNIADVSTMPSRVEPFGLAAIEAMACGTPVVATNEGGLPDFVDERVGKLVDVDDAAGLAKAIIGEVKQGAKASKGPIAAEYALKNFSWSGRVDKMIAIYQQSLAAGSH